MAAIVAFGPLFAFPLFISITERRDRLSLPVVLRAVNRSERMLVVPATAVVGFTGVYQAIDGPFSFDDDPWMTIGFALYLLVFGLLVFLVDHCARERPTRPTGRSTKPTRTTTSWSSARPTGRGCACRTRSCPRSGWFSCSSSI